MNESDIRQLILPWVDKERTITPTSLVLHWWGEPIAAGGMSLLRAILERRQLSVQYAVTEDGDVFQLSPAPDSYCRHAKCANESAIGIEIQGEGARDLDRNHVQYISVVALCRYLMRRYHISAEFRVETSNGMPRFFGIASHKLVDGYCENGSGKEDVHDEYLERVRQDIKTDTTTLQ